MAKPVDVVLERMGACRKSRKAYDQARVAISVELFNSRLPV